MKILYYWVQKKMEKDLSSSQILQLLKFFQSCLFFKKNTKMYLFRVFLRYWSVKLGSCAEMFGRK
ncbi:hypothetical protein HZS_7589 [Henneguya salminicola]|nr:hypothetical protein HZS_7589 [Henneguya salminicola]